MPAPDTRSSALFDLTIVWAWCGVAFGALAATATWLWLKGLAPFGLTFWIGPSVVAGFAAASLGVGLSPLAAIAAWSFGERQPLVRTGVVVGGIVTLLCWIPVFLTTTARFPAWTAESWSVGVLAIVVGQVGSMWGRSRRVRLEYCRASRGKGLARLSLRQWAVGVGWLATILALLELTGATRSPHATPLLGWVALIPVAAMATLAAGARWPLARERALLWLARRRSEIRARSATPSAAT